MDNGYCAFRKLRLPSWLPYQNSNLRTFNKVPYPSVKKKQKIVIILTNKGALILI